METYHKGQLKKLSRFTTSTHLPQLTIVSATQRERKPLRILKFALLPATSLMAYFCKTTTTLSGAM
jgi:hypothetical protein